MAEEAIAIFSQHFECKLFHFFFLNWNSEIVRNWQCQLFLLSTKRLAPILLNKTECSFKSI